MEKKSKLFNEIIIHIVFFKIVFDHFRNYSTYDRRLTARSSAAFMTAIIAIVIAIIAFAFALTSLVLVLLLRSTVYAVLSNKEEANLQYNYLVFFFIIYFSIKFIKFKLFINKS